MIYGRHFTLPVPVHQCGTVCTDGVELMGLATAATVSGEPPITVLYVPGQFDNAYQQRKNHALAIALDEHGLGGIFTNTRGQDYFGYQRRYPDSASLDDYEWTLLGSSFEHVVDAKYDIDAWRSFTADLAPESRIVLTGHSHGAIKIANYLLDSLGNTVSGRLAGVVLLSPSDDIGSQRTALGDRYEEALEWASERIRTGDPNALMPGWAFSAPMSAGTYHEAFGADSPLRTFAFHDPDSSPLSQDEIGWSYPTLLVFGSDDIATGPIPTEQAIAITKGWLSHVERMDSAIIDAANHHYRGFEAKVARIVVDWITKTFGS